MRKADRKKAARRILSPSADDTAPHHLPPQPMAWFQELIGGLGDSVKVRVAFKDDVGMANIITIRHKDTMVYKYGCSDARYHNLGGLPMLLWKAIEDAIGQGLSEFDFGRSDLDNEGSAIFKDRWGASRSVLTYWTSPSILHPSHKSYAGPWTSRFCVCSGPAPGVLGADTL